MKRLQSYFGIKKCEFYINRYHKEWMVIVVTIIFLLLTQHLYNDIESLSRAFKMNPKFHGGISMIPKDIVFAWIGFMLHIIPLSFWWLSIQGRVIQKEVKRSLLAMHGIMMFYIVICFLQCYVFDTNLFLLRFTGQTIALVMSYVPFFSFWAALCINQPIDYVPPFKYRLLVIPCTILALAGTTDEFHHQMLIRYQGENYNLLIRPNYGFYLFLIWTVFFYFLKSVIIYQRGNRTKGHEVIKRMPIFFNIFLMVLLYINIRNEFAGDRMFIELEMCYLFFEALTWECMIFSGMAQANFEHKRAFKLSSIPMEIRDIHQNIYDQSIAMDYVDDTVLQKLEQSDQYEQEDGIVYRKKNLQGGTLFWKIDTNEIKDFNRQLEISNHQLMESQFRLDEELNMVEERETYLIREKLYQRIYEEVKPQLEALRRKMMQCGQRDTKSDLNRVLFGINALSVFIKRYINATLLLETQEVVGDKEQNSCLREMNEVLKDGGIILFLCEDIKNTNNIKANDILLMLKCWIILLEYADFQCESMGMVIKEEKNQIRYEIRLEKSGDSLPCGSDFEGFIKKEKEEMIEKILKITENEEIVCVNI